MHEKLFIYLYADIEILPNRRPRVIIRGGGKTPAKLVSVDFFSLGSHSELGSFWRFAIEITLRYTPDFDLLLFSESGVCIVEFIICSRGISYLSYFKNSSMHTPDYLKYLQFSETFFSTWMAMFEFVSMLSLSWF